jgi:hypothetical protein
MVASGLRTMIAGSYPAVSLVSLNPAGSHNHPARDARALAQSRISLLLALRVPTGRATADRHRAARVDPARMSVENPLKRLGHVQNGANDSWETSPVCRKSAWHQEGCAAETPPNKFPCEARKAYQRFHDAPLTLDHSSRLAMSQVCDRVTTKQSDLPRCFEAYQASGAA